MRVRRGEVCGFFFFLFGRNKCYGQFSGCVSASLKGFTVLIRVLATFEYSSLPGLYQTKSAVTKLSLENWLWGWEYATQATQATQAVCLYLLNGFQIHNSGSSTSTL